MQELQVAILSDNIDFLYSIIQDLKSFSRRRIVASANDLLPHAKNEKLSWKDSKWSADYSGLDLCSSTYFIEPLSWINSITQSESGKITCPKCKAKLGSYNWVMGKQSVAFWSSSE